MLILQIVLTIVAWRKGWRQRALIPVATALTVGFLVGGAVGASGGTLDAAPLFILGDFVCIGVLIAMVRRAPAGVNTPETAEATPLPETALDALSSYAPSAPIVESHGR